MQGQNSAMVVEQEIGKYRPQKTKTPLAKGAFLLLHSLDSNQEPIG